MTIARRAGFPCELNCEIFQVKARPYEHRRRSVFNVPEPQKKKRGQEETIAEPPGLGRNAKPPVTGPGDGRWSTIFLLSAKT